jgi:hypothetical protein
VDVSDATIARVIAALSSPIPQTGELAHARRERQRRELALAYASGKLSETGFLSAIDALKAEPEPQSPTETIDPKVAVSWLMDLDAALTKMHELATSHDLSESEVDGQWARLIHAIYQRITVKGTVFVEVKLTPTVERHGLALALPEEVGVWYGGPDRGRTRVTTLHGEEMIRIPIAGRDQWEEASSQSA